MKLYAPGPLPTLAANPYNAPLLRPGLMRGRPVLRSLEAIAADMRRHALSIIRAELNRKILYLAGAVAQAALIRSCGLYPHRARKRCVESFAKKWRISRKSARNLLFRTHRPASA